MEKVHLDPWLIGLIKEFTAAHPGAELHGMYEQYLETYPGTSWKGFLTHAAIRAKVKEQVDAVYQLGEGKMSDFEMWAHRITDVYEETVRRLREAGVDPEILRRTLREEMDYVQDHVTEYKDLTVTAVKAVLAYVALTESLYGCEGLEAVEAWEQRADTFFLAERYADALGHYRTLIAFLEARPELAPHTLADSRNTAGACLMVLGRNDEALDLLLKALPFYAQDPVRYRRTLRRLCGTIAEVYYRLGNGDKMLEYYDLGDRYKD